MTGAQCLQYIALTILFYAHETSTLRLLSLYWSGLLFMLETLFRPRGDLDLDCDREYDLRRGWYVSRLLSSEYLIGLLDLLFLGRRWPRGASLAPDACGPRWSSSGRKWSSMPPGLSLPAPLYLLVSSPKLPVSSFLKSLYFVLPFFPNFVISRILMYSGRAVLSLMSSWNWAPHQIALGQDLRDFIVLEESALMMVA